MRRRQRHWRCRWERLRRRAGLRFTHDHCNGRRRRRRRRRSRKTRRSSFLQLRNLFPSHLRSRRDGSASSRRPIRCSSPNSNPTLPLWLLLLLRLLLPTHNCLLRRRGLLRQRPHRLLRLGLFLLDRFSALLPLFLELTLRFAPYGRRAHFACTGWWGRVGARHRG